MKQKNELNPGEENSDKKEGQSDDESCSYGSLNSQSSVKVIKSAKDQKLEEALEQIWEVTQKTETDGVDKSEAYRIIM